MSHATPQTLLVRGARVEGQDATDLLVKDGVIAETGSGLSHAGATVVDADGLLVDRGSGQAGAAAAASQEPPVPWEGKLPAPSTR